MQSLSQEMGRGAVASLVTSGLGGRQPSQADWSKFVIRTRRLALGVAKWGCTSRSWQAGQMADSGSDNGSYLLLHRGFYLLKTEIIAEVLEVFHFNIHTE